MLDLNKYVKLKNPEHGEKDVIYKVVNYNNVTRRCYIEPINLSIPLPPQELISIDDIVNI